MVDFTKLMNLTPEEREANRVEMYERLETQILSRIAEQRSKIEPLVQCIDAIPEKHIRFIRDMQYRNESFDRDGRQGGALSDLSEKQISYLNSLYKQYAQALPANTVTTGVILDIKDGIVVQKKGRDGEEVRHDASSLSSVPKVGALVSIKYVGDRGQVTDLSVQKGNELGGR